MLIQVADPINITICREQTLQIVRYKVIDVDVADKQGTVTIEFS